MEFPLTCSARISSGLCARGDSHRPGSCEPKGRVQFRADVEDFGARRVVRLAGRLEGHQASEVVRLCGQRAGAACLDLVDLVSADESGFAVLEMLRGQGVEIVGASPYLALQWEVARAARARRQAEAPPARR